MPKAHQGKRSQRGYSRTVLFAYHEAGHAVVGHVIGRCIEEVSILSDRKEGYKGYCRFSSWIESANDQNQWLDGKHNPELLTIFYAGMLAAAFFVDAGSSFNWRTKGDQSYSSEFLADQPFLTTVGLVPCPRFAGGFATASLSSLVLCNNAQLASSPFLSLVARDNRLVTQAELEAAQTGQINPLTQLPFGFQPVFIRGEAQTITVARLSESKFAHIGSFASSIGAEIRVQVPILNVPFRLIYAYNPRARRDQIIDGFPFFFNEKKTVFRFSVGRTF